MEKGTMEAVRSIGLADLKDLAVINGPCLTITLPIQPAENTSRQDYMSIKSAAQSAEPILAARGLNPKQIRQFLDPLAHINGDSWGTEFGSLVIFRSPEYFRCFQVRDELKDSATVADHFQVLPYLRAVQDQQRHFYILALSQSHARLLRCTNHSSEDVPLGPETPTSVEQWLNTRTPTTSPDHGAVRESPAGSTEGNFTSTQDRDKLDQHIANFFHRIDEAVFELLRNESAPLVLAGVEYEVSMYRDLTRYAHLAPDHVHGAPDSLKGGELHKRALEAARAAFEAPLHKALETYERLGGSERASRKVPEIVAGAAAGRVAHLFIAEGSRMPGGWDKATMQVTSEGAGEDLLNIAALQTLVNGGEVWVTTPEKVPGGGPVAALFRY
jgi:hypothetical protein